MNGGKTRDHRRPPSSGQQHHRGKKSRSFGIFFHQLDDKDGRPYANWPSRSNVPVSTWNVGVTAIDRAWSSASKTCSCHGDRLDRVWSRAERRSTARPRLHLTPTRADPGSPSRQARRFSRRRELICAIRIGPRENSPACAFRVNPRR
jgi:hypothetical protein